LIVIQGSEQGRFMPEAASIVRAKLLIPMNVRTASQKRRDPKD
jgi:hypothetical protein